MSVNKQSRQTGGKRVTICGGENGVCSSVSRVIPPSPTSSENQEMKFALLLSANLIVVARVCVISFPKPYEPVCLFTQKEIKTMNEHASHTPTRRDKQLRESILAR
jgi:hypothetical protein